MPPLDLYFAFIAATVLLIAIPGPNVALIIANSVGHGWRCGLLTVAGTTAALMLLLSATAFGMATVLTLLATWFDWLRWLGVAYLLYLGVQAWRAPTGDLQIEAAPNYRPRTVFLRGFLVSLTNPKTLLFYGAFFPQFLAPDRDLGAQLAVLSITFLVVAVILDSSWALLASRLRHLLAFRTRLRSRLTGSIYIAAATGLAAARRA